MRLLFFSLLVGLLSDPAQSSEPRKIFATERGGKVFYQGRTIETEEFGTAIRKARAGTKVILLPGTYSKHYLVSKQTDPEDPIIITGVEGLTTFACHDLPASAGKSPIKLSIGKGLIWENFTFENCWPNAMEITDSTHIIIRNNIFRGGRSAIRLAQRATNNILIERNHWIQDQTKGQLWSATKGESFSDYHGAFVSLIGVAGNITVTKNQIEHAYGGLQCLPSKQATANISFTGNELTKIKASTALIDCKIQNLTMTHNTATDIDSLFMVNQTIDHLRVWGNVVANASPNKSSSTFKGTGKIKKLMFVHNTVIGLDGVFTGESHIQSLSLHNNILRLTSTELKWPKQKIKVSTVSHNSTKIAFPKQARASETLRLSLPFRDQANQDYRAGDGSPAIDKGKRLTVGSWTSIYTGKAPDLGAYEGDAPVKTPPTLLVPIDHVERWQKIQ